MILQSESILGSILDAIAQCGQSLFWVFLIGVLSTFFVQWLNRDYDVFDFWKWGKKRYGEYRYRDKDSDVDIYLRASGDQVTFPGLSSFDPTSDTSDTDTTESDEDTS